MDELFEGMQYWRRDGSVSPPLVFHTEDIVKDPETRYVFLRKIPAPRLKLGGVWSITKDDKDLVAPYIPVQPTEEALQALL